MIKIWKYSFRNSILEFSAGIFDLLIVKCISCRYNLKIHSREWAAISSRSHPFKYNDMWNTYDAVAIYHESVFTQEVDCKCICTILLNSLDQSNKHKIFCMFQNARWIVCETDLPHDFFSGRIWALQPRFPNYPIRPPRPLHEWLVRCVKARK